MNVSHGAESNLAPQPSEPEVSVVIPCLNEADTLAICIEKALRSMADHGINGEVLIADNGSVDDSISIACSMGARVVNVANKGYGSALMGGIAAARGRFVIMGDADDSYDFLEIPKFIDRLREDYDLVQGCRLPSGGGRVLPGAMPFLHRWWGNPMFSLMVRSWFRAPIHDVYCGMRGFTKELYERLDQRCTGMEFATEMIIKSSLYKVRIAEVPITLHPDGRKSHAPHLRTFRDGWRTLRFFLLYSPRWLFLYPGLLLVILGTLVGITLSIGPLRIGEVVFDAHTLLYASAAVIIGVQASVFAILTKIFAINEGLLPEDERLNRLFKYVTLESGIFFGAALLIAGLTASILAVRFWEAESFGRLDYATMLRVVIPSVTALTVGFQIILSSFFLSVLGLRRK